MTKPFLRISLVAACFSVVIMSSISFFSTNAADNSQLNVDVKEVLSVSISTPTSWATGDVDTFLRNKVNINVVSSSAAGFTASMTMKTAETSLVNAAKNTVTLPTLATNITRANFPANYWGYSLDDTEAGSNSSTYRALVGAGGTPISVLSSTTASSGSKDIYFGAKANTTQASGTYTGTVVISVVSGINNPVTPVDPPKTPVYDNVRDITTYTYINTSGSTTTEISSGDTRGVYNNYVPPQGVISRTFFSPDNTISLVTLLALASAVAMTSGIFFLFAARREEEDDEI